MAFLTDEKLVIVGAAGMIGSNMVQSALMMNLTSNICLYDVFSPEGVAEEMRQSGFCDAKITATTDVAEAFKDAKYIISSGGAPRKEGMTREDLLAGNCKIAEDLGKNRSGDSAVQRIEAQPGDYTGSSRQHTSAERSGQEVRCDAEPDCGCTHIRWPR